MAEATRRYMLTATVRQAELHCSVTAVRAHAGVECPHVDVTVGGPRMVGPRKGQPVEWIACIRGCTDVRLCVVRGSPVGDVYFSSGLYCIWLTYVL